MSFHQFVARRYIFGALGREEGRLFLRFVTLVAIGGVAVGVATLLLALSIVRGFSREIEAKVIGFGAHVQVENMRYAPLPGAPAMLAYLDTLSTVTRAQPVVSELALFRESASSVDGANLWGTDSLPGYIQRSIVEGNGDFSAGTGMPHAVMGATLAGDLGLEVGDTVVVFSMANVSSAAGGALSTGRPRIRQFAIGGLYETSLADFDETYVFCDINIARDLFDYGDDEVSRIDVTLQDISTAREAALDIEEALGLPVQARTIYDIYRGLFAWVRLQEAIIPLVIGILILVAAFNLVATLLIVILEKTREIGILASMGASRRKLRRIFLSLGLRVGSVGTGIGLLLAFLLAIIQERWGVIPLPAEAYYMTTAPIALHPLDFGLVAVVAMILTAIAAYIPAGVAARVDPIKVIRLS